MRQLPHLITLIRLAASPILAWLLLQSRFREALIVALAAGLTDWFDGFAARRLQVSGQLGVILDPLADKVLLMTVFVTLGYLRLVPGWLIALVIARDFMIVFGALLLRTFWDIRRFLPSIAGKVSTFFQIVFVVLVLIEASFRNEVFLWPRELALVLCTALTIFSGFDYIRRGVAMSHTNFDRKA